MLALTDKWIWDFWVFKDHKLWHMYFLMADKALGDPELRHWNVSQGHATSSDLTNWTFHGECLRPSPSPAWDDLTTWTGSVVKEGSQWHLFYTGCSQAEQGLKQRIGHAVSTDGYDWQRVGKNGLCLDIDTRWYEEYTPGYWPDRAMRDPWVMRDPDGSGWLMYYTARVPGMDDPLVDGAIGLATSPDLYQWTAQPPVWQGAFGQLEVPQVFTWQGRWYCLFCTAACHWSEEQIAASPFKPHSGTHYLMAEHPLGPWRLAPGYFLDGSIPNKSYAGRVVETPEGLVYMAFLKYRDNGEFIGAVSDPVPVQVSAEGLLSLSFPLEQQR